MPFIPHTQSDTSAMLASIGADSIDDLFDEIPADLRGSALEGVPDSLSELAVTRLMQERAARDQVGLSFLGGGAYEHHIPAAVWEITTRGEFYSAYTPYQAEASQGTLQVIYEYQSMLTALLAMDVSNASLYDGASALAEAALMAVRANRTSKSRRVLLPATVNPRYHSVLETITGTQGVEFLPLPYDLETGVTDCTALDAYAGQDITALVIPQPGFFGALEDVDRLTNWAAQHGALSIAVVNPLSLAMLKPPGQWGAAGVDIACGEGQPLGVPLSSGGPYFGFLTARQKLVRQMPGRIVGRTVDVDGREGFTLTLQAREQHIRRGKATSNICTNQGLVVTAATIYMALLGPVGLRQVATACHANAAALKARLEGIAGVQAAFSGAHFHEFVIRLDQPVDGVLDGLAADGILGGLSLGRHFPELGNALLVCATETKTPADLERYAVSLERQLETMRNGV